MTLALEIAALVVLLLIVIGIAHYDNGPAGTAAKILVVLATLGAICATIYGVMYWISTDDSAEHVAHMPRDVKF